MTIKISSSWIVDRYGVRPFGSRPAPPPPPPIFKIKPEQQLAKYPRGSLEPAREEIRRRILARENK